MSQSIDDIILHELTEDLKKRLLSFTVRYHSAQEAQWQLTCVEVAHPWGFDAFSRHRRAFKLIIVDGRLIITNDATPLRLPCSIICSWDLGDPDWCVAKVQAQLLVMLQRQNEVVYQHY
jgi:hypothetical protein